MDEMMHATPGGFTHSTMREPRQARMVKRRWKEGQSGLPLKEWARCVATNDRNGLDYERAAYDWLRRKRNT